MVCFRWCRHLVNPHAAKFVDERVAQRDQVVRSFAQTGGVGRLEVDDFAQSAGDIKRDGSRQQHQGYPELRGGRLRFVFKLLAVLSQHPPLVHELDPLDLEELPDGRDEEGDVTQPC